MLSRRQIVAVSGFSVDSCSVSPRQEPTRVSRISVKAAAIPDDEARISTLFRSLMPWIGGTLNRMRITVPPLPSSQARSYSSFRSPATTSIARFLRVGLTGAAMATSAS